MWALYWAEPQTPVTALSPRQIRKEPLAGLLRWILEQRDEGYARPILGLTLRASRCGPAIRLSKIVPDNFVESQGPFTDLSPPDTKKPLAGLLRWILEQRDEGYARPIPGLTLRASRCGPAIRLSKIVPDNFVEPQGPFTDLSPPDTKKAPVGASLVSGGERVRSGLVRPRPLVSGQPAAGLIDAASPDFPRPHVVVDARHHPA